MAIEEQDPEARMRLEGMVKELQRATAEKPLHEVQAALANLVAIMCLSMGPELNDEIFITTQSAMAEVYLAMRSRVREGKPPGVAN